MDEEPSPIPTFKATDEAFKAMVHVALKLRSDILAHTKYTGCVVNEDEMLACVPESVLMFLRLMFGGDNLLEGQSNDEEAVTLERLEAYTQTRVLSMAQDFVYNVTGGKLHWKPKHVGLASCLHQAWSKDLVNLFHNAGHNQLHKRNTGLCCYGRENATIHGSRNWSSDSTKLCVWQIYTFYM